MSSQTCNVCGNYYDKAFRVEFADGRNGTFDSFQCAIHMLAPRCKHCEAAVIGIGVENNDGDIFCCKNCAKHSEEGSVLSRMNESDRH